jgi:hypothetical protein
LIFLPFGAIIENVLRAENQYFLNITIYLSVHFAIPWTLLPEAATPLAPAP